MSNLQRIKIGFNVDMGGDPVCLYNEPSSIPLDHIEDANGNTISDNRGMYYNTVDGLNEFTYFLTGDTIGQNAFRHIGQDFSPVVSIYVYGGVHNLGSYAFAVENVSEQVTAITLEEGVEKIGYDDGEDYTGRTFETITGVTAITIPSTVNEIGRNAFYNFNGATFTFCGATPTFDMSETGDLGSVPTVYVPAAYLNDYQTALSAYMPNIFPYGDVPTDDNLTNLNIKAAYVGDVEVVKMYLGNDVVWGGSEPEPIYSAMPLTFNIISADTISFIINKDTYTGPELTIEYKLNDDDWSGITNSIEGTIIPVSPGDIVQFRGNNPRYTNGGIIDVQNTQLKVNGLYKIYGNISSLMSSTNFTSIDGYPIYCFWQFFAGETGLTEVTELAFGNNIYNGSSNWGNSCFQRLFKDCTNLTFLKTLAQGNFPRGLFRDWLKNVSPTGTFVKHPNAVWTSDTSGIPTGWTVEDATI